MPLVVSTPPGPPGKPVIYGITGTSVNAKFTDGLSGSNAIDFRRLCLSTNGTTPDFYWTAPGTYGDYIVSFSDGDSPLGGLTPGATYYVWARCHSFAGYGSWSARATFVAKTTPDPPTTPWIEEFTNTSVKINWNPNFNGGSEINGYQINWGTNPGGLDQYWNDVWPPLTFTGLTPGVTYYFRAQARNSVGYSGWSGVIASRTIAGAYVNDNGTWRLAVPWVKDSGVWRRAKPWIRDQGTWRQTS